MSKHTPGPWSVYSGKGVIQVDIGPRATGHRPCIVHWSGFDSNDLPRQKDAANARLIAAAPDLLHALEMVRDANRDDPHIPPAALACINAAIEKGAA